MIRKRGLTLLTAAFMVLAFSAMALAANNVRLTTTVPNIPKSTCYQAGTDTMEFDHLTAIAEGDVIQFTLNNKVTVCKTINMFVAVNAPNSAVLETSADAPVSTTGGTVNATGTANKQWGFLIQATAGSQLITATLRVRDTAVAGNPLDAVSGLVMTFTGTTGTDKLIMKLFDGKWAFGTSIIYQPAAVPVAGDYPRALNAATGPVTNILCIDTLTQDYLEEYVQNTPDSLPILTANKLFFSGDYRIAHIMAQQIYSVVPCAKATVGNILIGAQGQPDTCQSFDFETAGGSGLPYCPNHLAGNKAIIATSATWEAVNYVVDMQIVVERAGVAKAVPGAYWSTQRPFSFAATTLTAVCAGVSANIPGALTYFRADGVTAAGPRAASAANCDLATAEKAVYVRTTSAPLTVAGDVYLWLDLPAFNYDPDEILAGDVVKVKITLTKPGCGTIGPLYVTVGTFGCDAAPIAGSAVLCPYVTSLNAGDSYWNGIAIANTSATTAGTVNLTAYKNDGTTSTFTTPSIAAGGMYVSLVSSIGWLGTTPSDVPAFIRAVSATIPAGSLEAFVMMADGVSNSMGYLCK